MQFGCYILKCDRSFGSTASWYRERLARDSVLLAKKPILHYYVRIPLNLEETCYKKYHYKKFDPIPWDDKMIVWENKKFIRDSVCTVFYMPLNFGSVMKKLDKVITQAGVVLTDGLCLSDHTSKWNMDLYLAVDKVIPNAENVLITGKFYSKVYEGSFQNTGKWTKDFESIVKSKEMTINKLYMWYTTCPKCAKKYGKNYVALLAQVE